MSKYILWTQKPTLSIYISGVQIRPVKSIKFICRMFPALKIVPIFLLRNLGEKFFWDARWGGGWKKAAGWLPAPGWAGPPPPGGGGGVGSALRKALIGSPLAERAMGETKL